MWETIKHIPQEPNGKISILCTNKKNTTKLQGAMFNMLKCLTHFFPWLCSTSSAQSTLEFLLSDTDVWRYKLLKFFSKTILIFYKNKG